MNTLIGLNSQRPPPIAPPTNLLGAIKTIRAVVGEALNDDELTRFLRESALPTEAGFAFLIFSKGYVMLSVPHQDPSDWYPRQGWIAPDKERIARAIAKKYELSLYEPMDMTSGFENHHAGSAIFHHHLEFTDGRQTVIVAHPLYLKVCLFGRSSDHRYAWEALCPLPLGPDLLQDVSRLYEKQNQRAKPEPDPPASFEKHARRRADEILRAPGSLPRDLDEWLRTEHELLAELKGPAGGTTGT